MTRTLRVTAARLTGLWLLAGPALSMIDSSVVNVAVPAIAADLHSPLDAVQWTISGYLLAMAAGLPAAAWLGRRFGLLAGYGGSLALFTLASVACALAPDIGTLVAARAVQGLAGAPMLPLGLGLLLGRGQVRSLPAHAALLFFAAPALGPAFGGLLVDAAGWRTIFLINLPIGALALAGVWSARRRGLGDPGDPSTRIDLLGLIVLGGGLAGVEYGISQAPAHGWLGVHALPWWLAGLLLLAAYAAWARRLSRRARLPAVGLYLLADSRRALAIGLCATASVILYAVLFLAPVYLGHVQGHSATVIGLVLLPQGVVMAIGSRITRRVALRTAVTAGMAVLLVSSAGLLALDAATPPLATALLLCARGTAVGLVVQPLTRMLLGDLHPSRIPDANTLYSMAQRLAGSAGVALIASFFTVRAAATGSQIVALHECAIALTATAAAGLLACWRIGQPRP